MSTERRNLHIFHDPPCDGSTNMARDEYLLYSEQYRPAAIRIYGWTPPTISLGCFQRFEQISELSDETRKLAVVRRPTGGGAILHDREITYCLVVDDSLPIARKSPTDLYLMVHSIWRDALESTGLRSELAPEHLPFPSPRSGPFFCFQKPGRTDLIIGADKLLGSAQRRIPGRVMQHGSLILGRRFSDHPGADIGGPPAELTERWIELFLERLAGELDLERCPATWTAGQNEDVAQRRVRFASDEWTRRR